MTDHLIRIMDIIFFNIALGAAFVSFCGYLVSFLLKRVFAAKISMWILALVFVFLTSSFGIRCLTTGESQLLSLHGVLSFLAWVLTGGYLLLQLKTKTRVLGIIVSPLVLVILIVAWGGIEAKAEILPILKGSLVPIHVMLVLAGEGLFILASGAGAMYLLQDRLIKKKHKGTLSRLLPSLADLDGFNRFCLLLGFPLLTLGIASGAVSASTVWGSPWQWDPKQIWTILAWGCFGFLLFKREVSGARGRKMALFSVTFLVLLLVSYLAVRGFLPTIHRFS